MEFSACIATFSMVDLERIIDTSAKLGYDAVELTAALHLPMGSTPEHRKKVLDWIHDAGIVCSALHYTFDGVIRFLNTDSEMMSQFAAYLKQVVDVVYDTEYPTVIVGSGGKARSFGPDWGREAGVKCMAEIIRRVGLYVQERGVILVVEAINRYKTNLLNTLEEAVNFVNMVNLPSVRTTTDTYHPNMEEVNPAETVHKYGHTLANLHLANPNRQTPEDGHSDFVSVAEALRGVDFKGYCPLKIFGPCPWKL